MWPIIGKMLLTMGKAVIVEAGAKHLIKRFSPKQHYIVDKIDTLCNCSGFFMKSDDLQDQEHGLVICNKCGIKVSRHMIVQKKEK